MKTIRTYNNIAAKGLNRFPSQNYQVSPTENDPQAILLRSHKLHSETLPKSVLAVARAGAGVNNIPVNDYTHQGIVVFNTPGANANAVKELVMASLLLGARGISQSMAYVKNLADITDSSQLHTQVEAGKKQFGGFELEGKTLGVVGLGAIGAKVANMALNLGMQVIGYDPKLSVDAAWRLSSQVAKADNLNSLLARSDYVTLHVPAIEATIGLINQETLSAIKQGAKLINLARGELINEADVINALDNGKLGAYIADFPTQALIKHDKVMLFPHLGASTAEAEENCAVMAADQLIDFLENGNIKNSVNFPHISMERTQGYRITFANDNVPKVLGEVLNLLADLNINVIDMVNRSRDNIAYTILDIDQQAHPDLIEKIAQVEHVFHVRAV
ncbi:3-phosphoglycerate dehydrogenase family protein [Catenovulum sp. 2E275]|uniref:3-phosphoglycerate dehydrogenase family protein n=1 Tax=Catenovulum sp. 2E275 TaxID=2980497 RepID=UPI0021D15945|nr:3-phosphoglycerate dehydrogenase family protein [Catenovulum sp. 2E275]MCU4675657.1 3-phosphoglycerate dehydrogenase family protein [Catenovulum sp. 2E275]